MVVIYCQNYQQAEQDFYYFLSILQQEESWTINQVFDNQLCVETDDDLRYLFVDPYLFTKYYNNEKENDIVEAEEFFDYIHNWYGLAAGY